MEWQSPESHNVRTQRSPLLVTAVTVTICDVASYRLPILLGLIYLLTMYWFLAVIAILEQEKPITTFYNKINISISQGAKKQFPM